LTIVPWPEIGRQRLVEGPVAATIGVFDGVHRGHRALLDELVRPVPTAATPLVVTFRTNPKRWVHAQFLGDLTTWEQKVELLADAGVEWVVAIDFSPTFSTIPGRDFFLSLKKSFVFSKLVLGWDFSFGKDSATTAADLGWLADPETRLTVLPPFCWEGQIVSSSAVRQALLRGDLGRVRNLLGRPYSLILPKDAKRASVSQLLPPPGRYPVRVDGHQTTLVVEETTLSWESPPGNDHHHIVFV